MAASEYLPYFIRAALRLSFRARVVSRSWSSGGVCGRWLRLRRSRGYSYTGTPRERTTYISGRIIIAAYVMYKSLWSVKPSVAVKGCMKVQDKSAELHFLRLTRICSYK